MTEQTTELVDKLRDERHCNDWYLRLEAANEIERLQTALEDIALLDEADGHELSAGHAMEAVAIAAAVLGKHPSEIYAERSRELPPHNETGAA